MKTASNEINAAHAKRAITVITAARRAADGPGQQHPIENPLIKLKFII